MYIMYLGLQSKEKNHMSFVCTSCTSVHRVREGEGEKKILSLYIMYLGFESKEKK